MNKILFKTTIPFTADDWHVGRFSLLKAHLESLRDSENAGLYAVAAHDRMADANGDDRDLIGLPDSDFQQLWLFAVDVGGGLTTGDAAAIRRFVARGGALVTTRDHDDLGACLLKLGEIGEAHYFHSVNSEPDPSRHCVDDVLNPRISFPNYHSGRNGDLQRLEPQAPVHLLLRGRADDADPIARFPAHPHEGAVGVPERAQAYARVIAKGRSRFSGRDFNSIVAFDPALVGSSAGRTAAHSSFHHFADYNWDPRLGCPSFVTEPEGEEVRTRPDALDDVHAYVANLARWLARDPGEGTGRQAA